MKLELFLRLLDTFGADFRRWPAEHRAAAESLCRTSPEAAARRAAARRLDVLFDADRVRLQGACADDPARTNAIANAALRRIRAAPNREPIWRRLLLKPVGAALAAMVLAGWLTGLVVGPDLLASQAPGVTVIAALLGYGSSGIEELL
jgi:hypothetical protein